jgi:putative transposase
MQTHHRRSIRLQSYDYGQDGAYFVTICTHERACLFGTVADGEMVLNTCGCLVEEDWNNLPVWRENVELDAFVVMPNHLHGIVVIQNDRTNGVGTINRAPTGKFGTMAAGSLSSIVAAYKAGVTRRVNQLRGTPSAPVWQRNYYEHIVRDEADLGRIRSYIEANPSRWREDSLYAASDGGKG